MSVGIGWSERPFGKIPQGCGSATLGAESLEAETRGGEETPNQPGQPDRIRGRVQGDKGVQKVKKVVLQQKISYLGISFKTTLFLIPEFPAGFCCLCIPLHCVALHWSILTQGRNRW